MPRLPEILLTIGLLVDAITPAMADPLVFQCDITIDRTGEHTRRLMTVDLDQRRVTYGPLDWQDSGPSPIPPSDRKAFVRLDGSRVEWGVLDPKDTSSLSLDLATGAYEFRALSGAMLSHGRCRPVPDST